MDDLRRDVAKLLGRHHRQTMTSAENCVVCEQYYPTRKSILDRLAVAESQREALLEFYLAFKAVDEGIVNFDLHNAAVARLEAAEDRIRAALKEQPRG